MTGSQKKIGFCIQEHHQSTDVREGLGVARFEVRKRDFGAHKLHISRQGPVRSHFPENVAHPAHDSVDGHELLLHLGLAIHSRLVLEDELRRQTTFVFLEVLALVSPHHFHPWQFDGCNAALVVGELGAERF